MTSTETYRNVSLAALTIGFLTLGVGIYTAWQHPATGYEVSMYASTPWTFWVACGVALAIAVTIATSRFREQFAPHLLLLAGSAVLAITALPVIRSYYFYGIGDALTHLGWARELAAGGNPLDLFYPGTHLIAAAISTLGYDVRYAMLLGVPIFTALFFLFIPLTVRVLVPDIRAAIVGAFAGLLLLPIFNFGTSYMFVPFTMGLFFTPFVLYLVSKIVIRTSDSGPSTFSARLKGLLTVVGAALVFVHSQVMLDVLILLGTVVAIQVVVRRFYGNHTIASHSTIVGPILFLGGLFMVWNLTHEQMLSAATSLFNTLLAGATAGAIVQQRGGSLQEVGGSLAEMFLKLFLVNAIFSIIAAVLVLAVLFGWGKRLSSPERTFTTYLGIGGIVLLPFFLLQFVGSFSSFFFRHVGFGMILITLLGSVGIVHLSRRAPGRARPLLGVGAAVALALSVAIIFPSPYIYLPNHHVTNEQMEGYETMFEHRAPETQFAGVRGGVGRYSSAQPEVPPMRSEPVDAGMVDAGLPAQFDRDTYIVVTEADRQREVVAFREIRYSEETFQKISSQRGVSKIAANGQFDAFYVDS